MATSEITRPGVIVRDATAAERFDLLAGLQWALSALASLRLTLVLFSLSILLVFFGTLAQVDHDVWEVVNNSCFRVWWARFDWVIFERLAHIFFRQIEWGLTGGFWFPGGKLLGSLLLANLLSAHAIRFKVAASGWRLKIGIGVIAAGLVATYLAITSGISTTVATELSPKFCDILWQSVRGTLVVLSLAAAYGLTWAYPRMRLPEWLVLLAFGLVLAVLSLYLLAHPEVRIDDPGLRILWQLVKSTAAAVVLLVGCVLVFRKRSGIVLLHGGVALLMLSELLTGMSAKESQMRVPEGGTVGYSYDIRGSELAVIDHSPAEHDRVTVVPESLLKANVGAGARITSEELPFDVQVHRWLNNSEIREAKAGEKNPATAGYGATHVAEEVAGATGVAMADKTDLPAAYIELFSKKSGESLGTYLLSQWLQDQPIEVDGKPYDIAVRFERIYHPWTVTLKDFNFDRYTGTSTPKNYSADIVFKDSARNIDREARVWMNNPLRYEGTTLYQSGFDETTEKATVLQVVSNPAWMAPYVSCMLVMVGMLVQFGITLVRFLRRRNDEAALAANPDLLINAERARLSQSGRNSVYAAGASKWSTFAKWFPALVVLIFAGYLLSKTRMPKSPPSQMQIYEFAKLPLAYEGRIKPYDTLANNALQILSGRQELIVEDKDGKKTKQPAIKWLLDVISDAEGAADHRVFRIENLDLLQALDLEQRPGSFRYSLSEIGHKAPDVTKADQPGGTGQAIPFTTELDRQIGLAEAVPKEKRSLYQRKVIALAEKRNLYMALALAFRPPPISLDDKEIAQSFQRSQQLIEQLRRAGAPFAVPPTAAGTDWKPLMEAVLDALEARATKQPVNPATLSLTALLGAYARGDATEFNKQLAEYRRVVSDYERELTAQQRKLQTSGVSTSEILSQPKVDFEVFYNHFSPFYYVSFLYAFAFVLGVAAWLGWTQPLRQASIALLWFLFIVHTLALVGRVYISGRPPVTNLYSTAIFIGWAGVLLSLVLEAIYKLGLGNIVAAVIGALSLLVAHFLSLDGDTLIVLQAVLDTQFWLATHVVIINLGYSTTYLAGLFGVLYILLGHVFPVLDTEQRRTLTRMTYGTLCFAIFFSYIGTVLGGLWADNSWGRFWGWDPKENGALMIVLWNALALHARWAGLVKGRGLALLAVAGNIVVTWSYFGVNELGVGLHSYGASESSTAMWLLTFAASQLAIIALGAMPSNWFEMKSKSPTQAAT